MCTHLGRSSWLRMHCQGGALYKLSVSVSNDDDDEDIIDDMKARFKAIDAEVHSVLRTDEINVITWDRLYEAAQEDEELRPYHRFGHDLHIAGGVVWYKDRAVIPTSAGAGRDTDKKCRAEAGVQDGVSLLWTERTFISGERPGH